MVTRIISAVVGIAVAIGILFLSDTPVFDIAVAAISVIMMYELFSAGDCKKFRYHSAVCYAFAVITPFLVEYTDTMEFIWIFSGFCTLLLFAGFIALHKSISYEKISYMITATIFSTLPMCCLISMKNLDDLHGICYVILCLAGAWLGDSGAYFVGTFFGKRKLCPEISPKKTVEGAVGGVVTVGIVFVLYAFFYHMYQGYRGYDFEVSYVFLAAMGFICGILGIIGDLSASLIKRQYGIKDFGNIMPGHGGLMDRFDSVLFVAPYMLFVLSHFPPFI